MKRAIAAILIATATITTAGASVEAKMGGQPKVDVCHDGDDGFELITVAAPAVRAHVKHGDPLPGDTIAADSEFSYGAVWGEDCVPVPLPPPDADGDGVVDDSDACPNEGDEGNGVGPNGCPLPPPLQTLAGLCVEIGGNYNNPGENLYSCTLLSNAPEWDPADLRRWVEICSSLGLSVTGRSPQYFCN